ncbi:scaffolding protein [Bacillus mesophilum]|uniref:Scaffolding protein n=1 Tax=Bacillus mesophilum TaxID=1071718 RepID=A0A7V7UXE8_9BACI|nr:scaffolding protein [Bacillus mesophilum]
MIPLDLQLFAGEGGDGGGDGGDGSGGDGGAGAGEDGPFATFKTQDDLNKRLSRAEKKGQKALALSLGYETVEEMQEAIKKPPAKKQEPGKEGEHVDVDALVSAKLKEEQAKTFKRLVNSEVKVVANELGFADWEDALALADLAEVKEDDKGNITGVAEALKSLAEKKPHLLKQSSGNQFGANIPNVQKQQKENLENIKKLAQTRGVQATAANDPWKR